MAAVAESVQLSVGLARNCTSNIHQIFVQVISGGIVIVIYFRFLDDIDIIYVLTFTIICSGCIASDN